MSFKRVPILAFLALAVLLERTSASAAEPPTVAVLYFDYEGKDADLALLKKGLAQMLISDLSGNDAIRVVERERLQAVLEELKLQATSKIDQASAVKAGKLLGARYLVLGAYFDVMKTLRADARVVDVETGRVILSVGASGKPEEFLLLEQKLATDLGRHFTATVPRPAAPPPPASAPATTRQASPAPPPAPRRRPNPPRVLVVNTAIEYSRALDSLDAGDKAKAKESLKKVVKAQPDFELASVDLDRLMK